MRTEHARAVAKARGLVTEYGIRDPLDLDLEAIAMDRRVLVVEGSLKGSSARLLRKGNGAVIRVSASIESKGQKRFCVAHELGHFVLHEEGNQLALCTSRDMLPWYKSRPEEPEANAFAAELLMPEKLFREQCRQEDLRLDILEGLAAVFQATITATVYRYVELGIHVCALVVSERGKIRWFRQCPDFRFRLRSPGTRIDNSSCAADFFVRGDRDKKEEDVPGTAWLDDTRVDPTWMIREILVPMPSFESALSVLWVVPRSPLDRV